MMKSELILVAGAGRPLEALAPAVGSAAAEGYERIAIDIDGLAEFAVPELRALIRLLRIARAAGASVAVRARSPRHRQALREMGLERIFGIVG